MKLRRNILELVDVVVPESIAVGVTYPVKLVIKNTAQMLPTIFRYEYTIDDEDTVKVEGTKDTWIKAGEEQIIEIAREAKKPEEHWVAKVYRGITPKMDKYTEPQFVEEFHVPAAVPPPDIEITGFAITDPAGKEIYPGREFTCEATVKNTGAELAERVVVNVIQYKGDPAEPIDLWTLGSMIFDNVPAGEEVTGEATFMELSGVAADYNICALL